MAKVKKQLGLARRPQSKAPPHALAWLGIEWGREHEGRELKTSLATLIEGDAEQIVMSDTKFSRS
jgi:hypothetical protein